MCDNFDFKDELNSFVEGARWEIKRTLKGAFINVLKSKMLENAQLGRRTGYIFLEDIDKELTLDKISLIDLENILTEEANEKDNDGPKLFDWLLTEARNSREFMGIFIEHSHDSDSSQHFTFLWKS